MNVKLLQKVKRAILKRPDQFEMQSWFQSNLYFYDDGYRVSGGCGTAACIGGWAQHLTLKSKTLQQSKLKHVINVIPSPYELLAVTQSQGERLFVDSAWPKKFRYGYRSATEPKERAEIAAKRIDHFIKTKGRE